MVRPLFLLIILSLPGALSAQEIAPPVPVGTGTTAFELNEKDLLTEGIAFDERTGRFFVSSVHRRKIVVVDSSGLQRDFIPEGWNGVWGVFGLAVDAPNRLLWAATTALPQARGVSPNEIGRAGVIAIHLDTGEQARRVLLATDTLRHSLGDLAVASDGSLFVTDSRAPVIYVVRPGSDCLETFATGAFRSLQGITLAPDQHRLFVADYATGLYAIDLNTRQITPIETPTGAEVRGIDGLTRYGTRLIAIQNGTSVHRVLQMTMDEAMTRVQSVEVLEAHQPGFDEPTLGTIVGDDFYFIARSQWGLFGKDGSVDTDRLLKPLVMRHTLRP